MNTVYPAAPYLTALGQILARIDQRAVTRATSALIDAYQRDATIYIIGNGGSATTATHLALDIAKNPFTAPGARRVRCVALTDNTAALTAWGNDVDFESIFAEQLSSLWRAGDVLVVISGSGNSPNIVRAVEWVKAQGGVSVGLLGRGGGACGKLCDYPIVVPDDDYGHIESAHMALGHYWVEAFRALVREKAA